MLNKSTNNFEDIYNQMFYDIYEHGVWSSDKVRTKYVDSTPAKRKQIIGYQFRFDNSTDVLPLVRSRFIPIKSAISELYWIWIQQSNKVQDLRDMSCKFWDEFEMSDGTIGPAYGKVISKEMFGNKSQLHYIINEIKNNPDSTRIKTSLWDISNLHLMSLTPCAYETQWNVLDNKLILSLKVRSNDFALGLPANIYQYSILHRIVALECNLECGDIIYTIDNLHYYDRHENGLIQQFRYYNFNIKDSDMDTLPTVKINNFTDIWDFKPDDVIITSNNKLLPKYKFEIAV